MTFISASILLLAAHAIVPAHASQETLTIPVRIHLIKSAIHPMLNSCSTESDVRAWWPEVNSIWQTAGIQFEIISVTPLQALNAPPKRWLTRDRTWVKSAIPPQKLHADAIDLCIVHDMGPNGFYYGEPVVVSESPGSFRVRGGARHPIARVASHELGHVLTLQHRKPNSALMASNSTGVEVNEIEIRLAREAAAKWLAILRP